MKRKCERTNNKLHVILHKPNKEIKKVNRINNIHKFQDKAISKADIQFIEREINIIKLGPK